MLIQCDFDGTIITSNMSVLLREHFAHDGWQKIEEDYLSGLLTVEQSNILQYRLLKRDEEELREFVRRHAELRPGFTEFVHHCQKTGIPMIVVSSGLDFYIKITLEMAELDGLEIHSAHASFTNDGIAVTYRDPAGKLIDSGFKEGRLALLKERDSQIVYIGDGLSDVTAACQADHVFARDKLVNLLAARSIKCNPFSDFRDITGQLCSIDGSSIDKTS
jgi:2-hydroxy-3-keto-5-methylthiopentenyl-1-phosphate phosphatase